MQNPKLWISMTRTRAVDLPLKRRTRAKQAGLQAPTAGEIAQSANGRGSPRRDSRFRQLLDLAREGDLGAIAELWNRYAYRFPEDEP